MDSIIRLLPDNIANQIAAGEVIQRPASVVKELVENAIDAGATDIRIHIKGAGKTLIQVVDNGKGMAPMDARMAFERHATSKIRSANDLFALTTMGFRGEALPSIAAVAHVTLQTRTADDERGIRLELEGSRLVSTEPVACDVGANFSIRHLFFNVPARRKFLKQDSTEFQHILSEVRNIATVRHSIAFTLTHDEQLILQLAPATPKQRITDLFGQRLSGNLLSIQVETPLIGIRGFVSRTSHTRKRGAAQYFYANDRYMKHPFFHRMVMNAYGELIPKGDQPEYFLFFSVDPASIDVNISPTKTEIKFEAEQDISSILFSAIREQLMVGAAVPALDFDGDDKLSIPVTKVLSDAEMIEPPTSLPYLEVGSKLNADKDDADVAFMTLPSTLKPQESVDQYIDSSTSQDADTTGSSFDAEWSDFYKNFEERRSSIRPSSAARPPAPSASPSPLFGDRDFDHAPPSASSSTASPIVWGEYAVTSRPEGLVIIHLRRALYHIYYSSLKRMVTEGRPVSKRLLFPTLIDLGVREQELLRQYQAELSAIGFDISDMGQGAIALNAIPDGLDASNHEELVIGLLNECHTGAKSSREALYEQVIRKLTAYRASKATLPTSPIEVIEVISQLTALPDHLVAANGKTIISILTQKELLKRFGI